MLKVILNIKMLTCYVCNTRKLWMQELFEKHLFPESRFFFFSRRYSLPFLLSSSLLNAVLFSHIIIIICICIHEDESKKGVDAPTISHLSQSCKKSLVTLALLVVSGGRKKKKDVMEFCNQYFTFPLFFFLMEFSVITLLLCLKLFGIVCHLRA